MPARLDPSRTTELPTGPPTRWNRYPVEQPLRHSVTPSLRQKTTRAQNEPEPLSIDQSTYAQATMLSAQRSGCGDRNAHGIMKFAIIFRILQIARPCAGGFTPYPRSAFLAESAGNSEHVPHP